MRKREDGKALIDSVAVFLFFTLSFGSGVTRIYGFTLFPDEFGYWSSAAAAAGYDWSGVTAYGSYYSFGYGLFLTPILWLCQNAVWTYRIALGVNAVFLTAAFVLLQRIVRRLIPLSAPAQRILAAGIAVCYPVWLLYVNMTMTEVLLVFCFVLVCDLLLWYLERPTPGKFAAAGVSAVYMYTVHMRSLPILCACMGCMLLAEAEGIRRRGKKGRYYLKESVCPESRHAGMPDENADRKRNRITQALKLLTAVCMVGAAFFLAVHLKNLTQAFVYGKADAAKLSANDYSGQIANVKGLFTWRGVTELIASLLGKVYYLSLASFGLFFAGIWFFVKKIVRKNVDSHVRIFSLFVLLSSVGEILVCAVYTRGYGRIDGLCYGRYDELILSVLMAFGCFAILEMKHPVLYGTAVIMGGLPITAMLESIIKSRQLVNINGGYFVAGLSYLLKYMPFEPENYFWKAYAFAAVLTVMMIALLLLIRRQSVFQWMLLVWIGLEILLGMVLNENMVYRQNRVRYQDMRMVSALEEIRTEESTVQKEAVNVGSCMDLLDKDEGHDADGYPVTGRRIVCFGNADTGIYASVVQFRMREETIYFFSPEEAGKLRERDLVLACEGEDRTALETGYTEHEAYGIFHLYYNK